MAAEKLRLDQRFSSVLSARSREIEFREDYHFIAVVRQSKDG